MQFTCALIWYLDSMGYTHYWYYNPSKLKSGKEKAFALAASRISKYKSLLSTRGTTICGPMGEGEAEVADKAIAYNGDGLQGLSQETFRIDRDRQAPRGGFAFCKTGGKPYDTLVCLSLISLFEAFDNSDVFSYCSDGGEEEWSAAYDIYREVNARQPPTLDQAAPPEC